MVVGGFAHFALLSGDLVAGKIMSNRRGSPPMPICQRLSVHASQLFGIAIYQINIIILRTYASFLPEGSITQYYNASRLQRSRSVSLPWRSPRRVSRLLRGFTPKGIARLIRVVSGAVNSVVLVNVGAATGLIALGLPICIVLFGHGAFTHEAVELTAWTLFWLALALSPVAIVRVVGQVFYAFKQAKRPVQAGFWSMVVNAVAGAVFAYYFGIAGLGMGLALATSVRLSVATLDAATT